jgi:hypothetical protein
VKMPTDLDIVQLQDAVVKKYPSLDDAYCVCDGLKLYLQQSGNNAIQNMFYNGWQHDHYVTNLFVFGIDGMIIACLLNAPGSVHDSSLAYWGDVYQKFDKVDSTHPDQWAELHRSGRAYVSTPHH